MSKKRQTRNSKKFKKAAASQRARAPMQKGGAIVDRLLGDLSSGNYKYGEAGKALRSGDISKQEFERFRSAYDQFTGTTKDTRNVKPGQPVKNTGQGTPRPDPTPTGVSTRPDNTTGQLPPFTGTVPNTTATNRVVKPNITTRAADDSGMPPPNDDTDNVGILPPDDDTVAGGSTTPSTKSMTTSSTASQGGFTFTDNSGNVAGGPFATREEAIEFAKANMDMVNQGYRVRAPGFKPSQGSKDTTKNTTSGRRNTNNSNLTEAQLQIIDSLVDSGGYTYAEAVQIVLAQGGNNNTGGDTNTGAGVPSDAPIDLEINLPDRPDLPQLTPKDVAYGPDSVAYEMADTGDAKASKAIATKAKAQADATAAQADEPTKVEASQMEASLAEGVTPGKEARRSFDERM